MTNKELKLLNKLITSLGYNINEIEDIFDYEEFCEHIIQEQEELRKKAKALEDIEEFCNLRKLNPVYALVTIKILDIINKAKEN